jgi:hypothetical protein
MNSTNSNLVNGNNTKNPKKQISLDLSKIIKPPTSSALRNQNNTNNHFNNGMLNKTLGLPLNSNGFSLSSTIGPTAIATKTTLAAIQAANYNWSGSQIFTQSLTINGASIFLNSSSTLPGSEIRSVYNGTDSDLFLCTGSGGTETKRLGVYSNGVVNANSNNQVWNKLLCLYEVNAADTPLTATNFYGLGINSNTLRYQVASTSAGHTFYGSTTQYATINNSGMTLNGDFIANGSGNIKAGGFVQNLNNIFSYCNIIV